MESPATAVPNHQMHVGYVKIGNFQPVSSYISETEQDRDTVTMEG